MAEEKMLCYLFKLSILCYYFAAEKKRVISPPKIYLNARFDKLVVFNYYTVKESKSSRLLRPRSSERHACVCACVFVCAAPI